MVTKSWQGASLQRALSGDVPLFLAHRSVQQNNRLPEVVEGLGKTHGDELGVGTIARLPVMTRKTAEAFAGMIAHVPVRVFDPDLHVQPEWGWNEASAPKARWQDWTFLSSRPSKVDSAWVKTVLDTQRELNASVLLSASGWVPEANGQKALQEVLNWVRESRQQAGDMPFWVNLTLDSQWLSDRNLRNILIEEIVESNESSWYLRFWWPEVNPRYGQLTDEAVLNGYIQLAYECDNERKKLYLPNSGLSGWLLAAKGAAGFSTGTSWGEQAFSRQRVIARQKGAQAPPRIPRLFDLHLMHTMQFVEHERISEIDGHTRGESAYLDEIEEHGHHQERAGLHYLAAVGALTAKLNVRNPQNSAAQLVQSALKFANHLSPAEALSGVNYPAHLKIWDKALS